jgi:hypothetical protein
VKAFDAGYDVHEVIVNSHTLLEALQGGRPQSALWSSRSRTSPTNCGISTTFFYRPEPLKTDGLYHTVDLKVKGRKDLVVRCRKGYYAPKL